MSLGLDNFKEARRNLQDIEYDEQKILTVINKLKQKEIVFKLFDKMEWRDENNKKVKCQFFKPPFLIAREVASRQRIRLKYFERNIVNYVVASHIEPKIYSDSVQNNLVEQKVKGFRNESINKTASISKAAKGRLKGLADIEMLQLCNIGIQFRYNVDYTLFAVTFDKKLSELLHERTGLSVYSEELSSQDNIETYKSKLDGFITNSERIDFAQKKQSEALDKLDLFYQHLEPLIC